MIRNGASGEARARARVRLLGPVAVAAGDVEAAGGLSGLAVSEAAGWVVGHAFGGD